MTIDEKAFGAFMIAMHENGTTGLAMRENLIAYEAAKKPVSLEEMRQHARSLLPLTKLGEAIANAVTKTILDAAGVKYD